MMKIDKNDYHIDDVLKHTDFKREKYKGEINSLLDDYKNGNVNSHTIDSYFLMISKKGYRLQRQRNEYMRIASEKDGIN